MPVRWAPGGRGMASGWSPSRRGVGAGGRKDEGRGSGGPQGAAGSRGVGAPAVVARDARPRDGGPGQGHTAPGADSLAGPAPRPGAPRPSRLGPGCAASVSPRCRAGPGRAGRGRGRRAARAAGRAAAGGARLPVEGDGALLPLALPVGTVRGRTADHHLGPQAAAPPPGSGPRLAAPRRERDRPEGRARGDTAAGRGSRPPRLPYGKMAAHALPPGRPAARPGLDVPGLPSTRLGAARGSRRRGWAGAARAGGPVQRHGALGRPYGKMAAPAAGALGGLACPPRGPTARPRLPSQSPRVAVGVPGANGQAARKPGARAQPWALGLAVRQDGGRALPPTLPAPPAPARPGLAPAAARRVALRNRRSDAAAQSAAGEGRWTQVRARAGAGLPAGDALLAPLLPGPCPARRGCGLAAGPRGRGAEPAPARSGAGTASVGRPARV